MANPPASPALWYFMANTVQGKNAAPERPKEVVKNQISADIKDGAYQIEREGKTPDGKRVVLAMVDKHVVLIVDKKVVDTWDVESKDAAAAVFDKTCEHGDEKVHPSGVSEGVDLRRGMWVKYKKSGKKYYVMSATDKFVRYAFAPNAYRGSRDKTIEFVQNFESEDGDELIPPEAKPDNRFQTPAGTCGVCWRPQQTKDGGNMVDHGYELKGGVHIWGRYRSKSCWGVGKQAFELTPNPAKEWVAILTSSRDHWQDQIDQINNGAVKELPKPYRRDPEMVPYAKKPKVRDYESPEYMAWMAWDDAAEAAIRNAKYQISQLQTYIDHSQRKIDAWERLPLFDRKTGKPFGED